MMRCLYCGKDEEEVRLIEAIASGEVVKICEDCCEREKMPVISRPTRDQLRESEKKNNVYNRLKRISGYKEKDEISEKAEEITNPKIEKKVEEEEQPVNLIENFHWKILMARKKKRMTRKELARELGESEAVIRMIENKKFPKDSLVLIKKLEQYFGIRLREDTEEERERRRLELKEKIYRLRRKKEEKEREEIEIRQKEEKTEKEKEEDTGGERKLKELKFNKKSWNNITIDDLRKMKKAREEEAKIEKGEDEAEKLVEEVEREKRRKEKERIRKAREMIRKERGGERDEGEVGRGKEGDADMRVNRGGKSGGEGGGGMLGEVELE